jgi:hypothetical protein
MRAWHDLTLDTVLDRKATPRMPRWLALALAAAIVLGGWFLLRDRLHPPEAAPQPGSNVRIPPADR